MMDDARSTVEVNSSLVPASSAPSPAPSPARSPDPSPSPSPNHSPNPSPSHSPNTSQRTMAEPVASMPIAHTSQDLVKGAKGNAAGSGSIKSMLTSMGKFNAAKHDGSTDDEGDNVLKKPACVMKTMKIKKHEAAKGKKACAKKTAKKGKPAAAVQPKDVKKVKKNINAGALAFPWTKAFAAISCDPCTIYNAVKQKAYRVKPCPGSRRTHLFSFGKYGSAEHAWKACVAFVKTERE